MDYHGLSFSFGTTAQFWHHAPWQSPIIANNYAPTHVSKNCMDMLLQWSCICENWDFLWLSPAFQVFGDDSGTFLWEEFSFGTQFVIEYAYEQWGYSTYRIWILYQYELSNLGISHSSFRLRMNGGMYRHRNLVTRVTTNQFPESTVIGSARAGSLWSFPP